MQAKDLMTNDIACCRSDSRLEKVARMMVEHDCGAIPVVDDDRRPVGIITDRDIVVRAVARGQCPLELTAGDCMSSPVDTVSDQTNLEDCLEIMERDQIRRLVVVDRNGECCGMLSQADIALHTDEQHTAEILREVSQPA